MRARRIELTPELLLELLRVKPGGSVIDGVAVIAIEDAIPVAAKALRCGITENGNVMLLIEDDSFELIEEGGAVPRMTLRYRAAKL